MEDMDLGTEQPISGISSSATEDFVEAKKPCQKHLILFSFGLAAFYSTTFFVQITLLPYIVKELGIDNVHYGYLQTVFGLVQLVGGPIFGQLCDGVGVRYAMVLGFLSTATCYLLTFLAFDFWSLLLSRMACVLMHGFQGVQTILTKATSGQERVVAFGRLGVVFGVGFILGPGSAGILSSFVGYRAPLFLIALLCFLAIIPILRFVPALSPVQSNPAESQGHTEKKFDFGSYKRVLKYPGVLSLFIVKNLAVTPLIVLSSIFGLYLVDKFNVSPGRSSFQATYVGVCIAFMNGFGIVWLRKKFDEQMLIKLGVLVLFLTYSSLALVFSQLWHLFFIHPGMALGMTLINVVADCQITARVGHNEHGTVLGFSHAANSLIRSLAPMVAGFMLQNLGFPVFGYLGMVSCGLVLVCLVVIEKTDERFWRKDGEKEKRL